MKKCPQWMAMEILLLLIFFGLGQPGEAPFQQQINPQHNNATHEHEEEGQWME
jgi:hypothetical protein